jgi:preprotein translocase subunit YajC
MNNAVFLLLMVVVMYFFFFRPQIKRQKEEKKFRAEIAKGMRIVTSSGIHGKILELKEDYIVIESENSRLKIDKSAISKELSAKYLKKESSSATEKK